MVACTWRHSVGVALLLCVLLLITACQPAPPEGEVPVGQERTVTLWHSLEPARAEILQAIADEWAAQKGEAIRIRLEAFPHEEALHQRLTAAIQAELPPTLAFVRPHDIAAYVEADALLPMDPLMEEGEQALSDGEKEDYYLHFLDSIRYKSGGNRAYAWPIHRYQTLLFINRTRVLELGGDLPPDSWEALAQYCADHKEQGGEQCLAAFPTGSIAVLWIWSHGGSVVDASGREPAFQNEAGQAVMRWLAALRALEGVYQAPTYEASKEAFISGRTLFTFDSTAAIPEYEARINSAFDMVVLPPPSTTGEPVTVATGGNIAIFRGEEEMQKLAWDFLRFLTSTEVNYRWAEAIGAYPVRRSALEKLDASWPEFSRLRQAAEWLPVTRSEPMVARWPEITRVLAEAMIKTINGQETPEEALAEAVRRVEGLLEQ